MLFAVAGHKLALRIDEKRRVEDVVVVGGLVLWDRFHIIGVEHEPDAVAPDEVRDGLKVFWRPKQGPGHSALRPNEQVRFCRQCALGEFKKFGEAVRVSG